MTLTTWVVVRHRFDALHHWPNAPVHRAYLGQDHRHLFHVEMRIQVFDDDRALEFHDILKKLQREWCVPGTRADGMNDIGAMSCEMVAKSILSAARREYDKRAMKVSVFEDGENGAIVEWQHEAE